MEVDFRNFPDKIPDNDYLYFKLLLAVVESVDEYSSVQIVFTPNGYIFRISPSLIKYCDNLMEEIIKFHKFTRIKVDFSKSIKSSGRIVFKIDKL